jgi:DNA-binding NarL/FixJ family response regulator
MAKSTLIRVLLADDHPLVLRGMEVMLRQAPDMEIVGTAMQGDEAVRLALRTRPDVAVLDVRMPVKDGLTALSEIREALPSTRCVILTGIRDADLLLQAISFGAAGYVAKNADVADLVQAIRAVYHGGGALDPVTTQQLIRAYQARQTPAHERDGLTAAERRVLRLLARGLSNRELARELGVSERTVTTHVRRILDKLALKNRVQAALYANAQEFTA